MHTHPHLLSDPKPPRKPALPTDPERERPNLPVEPTGDREQPLDTPPEEEERKRDPRSRDVL